jgi:hypothetical protein
VEWRRQGAGLADVFFIMRAVGHVGGGSLVVSTLGFTDGVVIGLLERSQRLRKVCDWRPAMLWQFRAG